MDPITVSIAVLVLLVFILGAGVWVFLGLFLLGISSLYFFGDFSLTKIGAFLQSRLWSSATGWELAAIPMFVWMGEIIFRTNISTKIFDGLSPLLHVVPGRLLHTNVAGCSLFAMVSGSSSATTATVGRITIDRLSSRKYNERLLIGSLAGAGSLGLLIPPSLVLIVYGVLAEESIVRLFVAGFIPGLLLAALFSIYIMVVALINPNVVPRNEKKPTLMECFHGIKLLLPILVIIVVVLGGLYTGLVTPSEAAALGVTVTLIIAAATRQFNIQLLIESTLSAIKISCMIVSIVFSAGFLSSSVAYLYIPMTLVHWIATLQLSPYSVLVIVSFFFILLGMVLDGLSILVMTLSIVLPMLLQAGFDAIWFGIYFVVISEMATITPPIGINLFVIQGITNKGLGEIVASVFPFFLLMLCALVALVIFPNIALWLPQKIL